MPFTVEDFRDLIRLLEERPDLRAELQRLLLPEGFLTLPQTVDILAREVVEVLYAALARGEISQEEYSDILACDLLWGGILRDTGEAVILLLEISWTVDALDIERAALLRRLGLNAFAVAAGKEWPEEVRDLARQHRVVVVEDGMVNIASWEEARKGAMAS